MLRVCCSTARIRLSISHSSKQCVPPGTDAGRVLFAHHKRPELPPVEGPPQLAARCILNDWDSDAVLLHQTQIVSDIYRLKNMPALLEYLFGMLAEMAAGCGVECKRQHDEFSVGVNMAEQSDAAWNPGRGLTLYGRKPALEALEDASLTIHCLHLANSNRPVGIIAQIISEAESRGIAIRYHDRQALSRISRNGRQDQGVALDVVCPNFMMLEAFMDLPEKPRTVLALDGVTNPQNVGMIIRSAVAAGVDGVLYPKRGIASLGPLVIKASAGNVFRAPIIRCDSTATAVITLKDKGYQVATLEATATTSLFEFTAADNLVCVLGGESEGIGREVAVMADARLTVPMENGVESLNVAVTAALVSFHLGQSPD